MEDVFWNLLSVYGPFAVFLLLMLTGIGVPLSEDLIIIPAGVLIGHGMLGFAPTVIFAYLGVVGADLLWFAICWRFGAPLLHRRWFKRVVHPRRLLQVKHEIERRGAWVIVMSRFIPGSRTPAITAAGILHHPFRTFALAECACCLVTVPLQLGLGIAIAEGIAIERTTDVIRLVVGVVLLILAVLVGLTWWRQYRSQRQRPPRARAAWLRQF